MKKFSFLSVLSTSLLLGSSTAKAAPVEVVLTLTSDSGVELFVETFDFAVTSITPLDWTGTMNVILDDEEPPSSTIAFNGSDIDWSDETLFLDLGLFGGVDAALVNMNINITSTGAVPITPAGGGPPFDGTFDPSDSSLGNVTSGVIDEGALTFFGTGGLGGVLGEGTIDFSEDNLNFDLPEPQPNISMISQSAKNFIGSGGGFETFEVDVLLTMPLQVFDTITTDPVDINYTVEGTIFATGSYQIVEQIIPEPSTFVLLGVGAMAMVPLMRRWRQQRRSA